MNSASQQTTAAAPASSIDTTIEFSRAYTPLGIRAGFKQQCEDFRVDEQLPFELSGEGEHLWLQIRKRNTNTDWLAQQLAKCASVTSVAVGYAGLKDRQAVTTQWFSVHLPGRDDADFSALESADIDILQQRRHGRKLQRGAHSHNCFDIRLRKVNSAATTHVMAELQARCELVAQQGVPNYFGEQRFGHHRDNVQQAVRMFASRRKRLVQHKRSLYLSAARSWLFNQVLTARVAAANWQQRVAGDVFMLDGRSACFSDDGSAELDLRLAQGEIHAVASLYGDGERMCRGAARQLEDAIFAEFPQLTAGLCAARVAVDQRALRLLPKQLRCWQEGDDLLLHFELPAGAYATSVLRELVEAVE